MISNPKPQTKVNVLVGLPPLDADEQNKKDEIYEKLSYGGCAPEVSLFNANGDRVGYSKNKKCKQVISQNSPTDIWADYIKPGETEKAEYITVSASGTDAICISAIAVTYPTSSDTYAFLPGEVAAICNTHNPDYKYSWSPSATQIQFKSESGQTQDGRPKCLWIDKPDDDGDSATHYEGFQVHLPDFKLDNTTFHGWQEDPSQMCDSLARFGSYDRLDPMLCPEIFSPAPAKGASLPLDTVSACIPAAKDSTTDPHICEDDSFTYQQRKALMPAWAGKASVASKIAIFFILLAISPYSQIEISAHFTRSSAPEAVRWSTSQESRRHAKCSGDLPKHW
ncbi:uncharacterized protein J4E87_004218 [Alternaria ethzedia]|uniref:uncharacterized protein n=1 Tax=Alternaria ethzedia TaxID=181014 RepID=UPI0020C593E2|nr:uncharacterized protein J4E87_004218 [Alternaria ethzedia]KAI4627654.1 hypothetical protein J4E87_004218 [Alternaria ethzedia]